MNIKRNISKYQLDSVFNEASDKIDEICIQYSQLTNFVRDCSNLFPKTILILLIYVFGSLLIYSFMLFAMFRTFMVEGIETVIKNQQFIYLIINGVAFDSLNLYWLVNASAKMERQVWIKNSIIRCLLNTIHNFQKQILLQNLKHCRVLQCKGHLKRSVKKGFNFNETFYVNQLLITVGDLFDPNQ